AAQKELKALEQPEKDLEKADKAIEKAEAALAKAREESTTAERVAAESSTSASDASDLVTKVRADAERNRPRDSTVDLFDPPDTALVDDDLPGAVAHRREFHPHESPPIMWLPLVVLALGAIGAGALNLPFNDSTHVLEHWLEPTLYGNEHHLGLGGWDKVVLAGIAVVSALLGIGIAAAVYLRGRGDRKTIEQPVLAHAWYVDEGYAAVVGGPGEAGFEALATFDQAAIDGAVNGAATLVRGSGSRFRILQSGFVRAYALIVAFGAVGLLAFFISRATF
ncbi:MAG: hypothetical protein S0880_12225, partial [Actinomycetota bacterium]|nr:hypothetical protein [Actinomycetota bacterium]